MIRICSNSIILTCLIFNESLPIMKPLKKLLQSELSLTSSRRGGGLGGSRNSVTGGGIHMHTTMTRSMNNFHLDIERLFSAKVKIYDYVNLHFTTEGFVCAYFKAILKSAQENLRLRCIEYIQVLQMTTDMTMMKTISSSFMKENHSQVDVLIDQVLLACNRRCYLSSSSSSVSSSSVSSQQDHHHYHSNIYHEEKVETDPMIIHKAIQDAIYQLGNKNVMFKQ